MPEPTRPGPRSHAALLAVVLSALPSCVPALDGPAPRAPDRTPPSSFGGPEGDPTPGSNLAQATWHTLFPSAALTELIGAALERNQELHILLQEIVIAQNERLARRGEVLPRVAGGVRAGAEKIGAHTSQGVSDEAHGLPAVLGDLALGLSASWEVDVWHRLRDAVRAADLRYQSSREARTFVVTQLVGELVRAYYELLATDRLLQILERNVAIQAEALEVARAQKEAARLTERAVQRFEAEILRLRRRVFELQQTRTLAENRINLLAGKYPGPVRRDAADLDAPLPESVAHGLPADLLDNRPDVRRAALDLEAAQVDVRVARKAFYPSLSLDADAGYRAFNARHLLATPASLVLGALGRLTAPLINRAALVAEYRSANARQIQAVYAFERTLIQAFTEVVNQLAALRNLRAAYELQAQQVDILGRSVEVTVALLQAARADFMEVLLTRRDALEAEMELTELKQRQFAALAGLYQALGGGWRNESPNASAP